MDSSQDQTLKCRDCNQDFVFTAGEQQFFAERQFTPPTRCKPCRQANKVRKDAMNGGSSAGPAGGMSTPVGGGYGGPGPRVYEVAGSPPPRRGGGGRSNNGRREGGRGGGGRRYDDFGDD